MTKTKTKLRVAAAMLAVLLLTCAWVGAVSADGETVTFSYGADNELTNIWKTGSTYWIALEESDESGSATIPVMITGTGTNLYMNAYDVEATVSSADAGAVGFSLSNKLAEWKGAYKEGHLAVGFDTSGNQVQLSNTAAKNIFDVVISKSTLFNDKEYTITLRNNGVVLSADKGTIENTDGISATTGGFTDPFFVFHAKNKAILNTISFEDYTSSPLSFPVSNPITLYREHGSSVVSTVDATNFVNAYDTLTWAMSEGSESITSIDGLGQLSKNLVLSTSAVTTIDKKTGSITLKLTTDASPKSVPVNVENWVQSSSFNTGTPTAYNEGENWNFVKPIKYVYVVGAGEIAASPGAPWTTNVEIPKVEHGGYKDWTFKKAITNSDGATGSYDISNTKADGSNIGVTLNTVKDAAKTVTITLTGYPLGDANTNDGVDIVDSAVIGIQIIKSGDETGLSSDFLNDDQKIYADCNSATGDGKITVADVLAINKYLVGISPW